MSMDNIEAKKSLGQNFLKNPKILEKIANKTIEILENTEKNHKKPVKILEIGPGKGALTAYLLKTGRPVIAIETDERMIPILQEEFKKPIKDKLFDLIEADIREFDPNTIKNPYILVANIPYYLTGFIMRQFLESENQPLAMIVMVQKEVALRMVDTKQTLLSLSAQTYGKPSILTHVAKGNFTPAPKVDSSVLVINNISKEIFNKKPSLEQQYWEIAKKAFNSKRKQLGGTVFRDISPEQKEKLSKYLKERPENITPQEWVQILSLIS